MAFDAGVSDNDISEYRGHLISDDDTVSLLNGDVFLPNSIDFCEKQNADGKAFVEHVLPEAHHHFNSKYDSVSLLDFDLDEQTSLQKSNFTISNLSELSEPSLGIFEEVFLPDKQDYDSDDDYAYDELSGSYLRILDSVIAEPFLKAKSGIFRVQQNFTESQKAGLKEFKAYVVELSTVELSPEKTKILVSKIWHLHNSFNHPSPGQLLLVLSCGGAT